MYMYMCNMRIHGYIYFSYSVQNNRMCTAYKAHIYFKGAGKIDILSSQRRIYIFKYLGNTYIIKNGILISTQVPH